MDSIAKTRHLLGEAETKLVELAGKASVGRDYDAAGRILAAAQAIKHLEEQFSPGDAEARAIMARLPIAASKNNGAPSAQLGGQRKRNRLGEYPRFFKSGDNLIKVGWSKTDKAEYEHKCPRKVLSILISSYLSAGGNGKRFSMDDVLPLTDPTDGSELPAYQAYVALAWLKSLGFVQQHGRQGYSIRKGLNFTSKVENAWNSLA